MQPDTGKMQGAAQPPPAPELVLATPGAAERLARLLNLGEPKRCRAGSEILGAARQGRAAVALVGEQLADMSARELCRALRQSRAGSNLPLIIVSENYVEAAEEAALAAGADEYVEASQINPRLAHRLQARLRRAGEREEANPLTGLPGRGRLDRELARRLPRRGELALIALDVRHFKVFNDSYGYERGDQLLRLVAEVILQVLEEQGTPEDLVIHLGGDDFFLLAPPARAEALVRGISRRFDERVPDLYDEVDRQAGGLLYFTRTGEERRVPIAYLLTVGVTNEAEDVRHAGEMAQIVAELKEFARLVEKREIIWDRRQTHNACAAWQARPRARKGEE